MLIYCSLLLFVNLAFPYLKTGGYLVFAFALSFYLLFKRISILVSNWWIINRTGSIDESGQAAVSDLVISWIFLIMFFSLLSHVSLIILSLNEILFLVLVQSSSFLFVQIMIFISIVFLIVYRLNTITLRIECYLLQNSLYILGIYIWEWH